MLTCKRGTIKRAAFTRKNGSKVKASCVKNMGEPGKWRVTHKSKGIGPLKKGRLGKYGYSVDDSVMARHRALRKASIVEGARDVFRMLQAVATYTKRTSPMKSKRYLADRDYVRKMF